jgi:hypothetical protein
LPKDKHLLFTATLFEFPSKSTEIALGSSSPGGKHCDLSMDVGFELGPPTADTADKKGARSVAAEVMLKQLFEQALVAWGTDRLPSPLR